MMRTASRRPPLFWLTPFVRSALFVWSMSFVWAAFVSSALLLMAGSARAAEPQKLNVLLIISDDLRDTVGCYGNTVIKTPNIDRLAARGVRFDRGYVQFPGCNPSRASFLSGLRPEQTGVVDNATNLRTQLPHVITMPQLLRQQGWYTASYGKVFHLSGETDAEKKVWMDLPYSWDDAQFFRATEIGRKGQIRNLTNGKLYWCIAGPLEGNDDDQPDGQNAAHAVRAMEDLTAQGKSWMVAAGFHAPHNPFIWPKKYFDLYPPGSLTLYRDPPEMTPVPPLSMPGEGYAQAFDAFSDQDRMDFLHAYCAGVSFADAQVGRLLDTLDRLQLWDHTLVILLGDNGYHLNERKWWNKNTLFERSCRVPLIICAPDAKGGQVCRAPVEMVDLYPTVIDYSRLQPPHKLEGVSLRPLLKDPSGSVKEAAFSLVVRRGHQYGQSVRTDRWRYTQWSDETAELYDEPADPEETHNVVDSPTNAEVVQRHQALLRNLPPPRSTGSDTPQSRPRAKAQPEPKPSR
jgi:iduronate 2-sulfatase